MSLGSDQCVRGYDTIMCGERTVAGDPNWLIQNQPDAKRREIKERHVRRNAAVGLVVPM